jgi:hypothetical protein
MDRIESSVGIRDLLRDTYVTLNNRHKFQEIFFKKKPVSQIGVCLENGSECKRYLKYSKVGLFSLENHNWVIGRGERCFIRENDLIAFEVSDRDKKSFAFNLKLARKIEYNISYFSDSLVFGRMNGELGFNNSGKFKDDFSKLILPYQKDFIINENSETSNVMYKPEFSDFLADCVEGFLRSRAV